MAKWRKSLVGLSLLVILLVVAGCGGGGSQAQRIPGLSSEGVVKTFFNVAQQGKMGEAGLYVSPASKSNSQTVLKFITGQELSQIKETNLLSVKQVAQKDNYAVVLATLQDQQGSLKITVKPVGLEKINGEWYIVDVDQIYSDAKYQLLLQLIQNI